MKPFTLRTHHILLATVSLLTITLFTACDDNPAGNDEEEHEHAEPFGLELVHDGNVIIEYFDGIVTEHQHMHLHAGEEYAFTVQFLDEDRNHIHAEDFDDAYHLDWVIQDENVLQIEQPEGVGKWNFNLIGVAGGGSKVQFRLMHGPSDDAHSHLDTLPVDDENAIEFHVDAEGEGDADHSDEH